MLFAGGELIREPGGRPSGFHVNCAWGEIRNRQAILRMFRESDFEQYARTCADPEVMRYLGEGQTLNRGESGRVHQLAFYPRRSLRAAEARRERLLRYAWGLE